MSGGAALNLATESHGGTASGRASARATPRQPLFVDDLAGFGERPALVTGAGAVTYADLAGRVDSVAAALGPHRRLVMVEGANTVEALVPYLGALRGGHAVLLVPPGDAASPRGLAAAYDPDVVLSAGSGWVVEERHERSAHDLHDDLALLLATSGSTGSAKLVRLSRQNLQANAASIARYLELTDDCRAITTLPVHYCYGLSVIHSHLLAGASVVLTDLSVVDSCFWDLFRAAGATSLAGVPHTFDLLDRVGFASMSLPSLRYVTQAGGRLPPDQVQRYAALGARAGWRLYVMYGQTEATARMAYLPPDQASSHPASIGIAIPGGSFRIEDPDPDGVGELVYRGENVMLGYAEHPADLGLGRGIDELRTGDLARVGPGGFYEVVGRRSRFVKPFGVRVDLDQLELRLAEEGITAMCSGDDRGVAVAVRAQPGAVGPQAPAVARRLAEQLGLPQSRVGVVERTELPRLPNGKPDYATVLRLAGGSGGAGVDPVEGRCGAGPLPDPGAAEIRGVFAAVLGGRVTDEDTFVSLGGDSLSYVEMSIALEETLGHLPPDWHTTPVGKLRPSPSRRRLLGMRRVETNVVLRAAAITLVVGTHATLWHLPGGAHTLLAIAGFNFARFVLEGRRAAPVAAAARIAVPSMLFIGLLAIVSDEFSWPNALLLNSVFGVDHAPRDYWFIQTLVAVLGVAALLLAIGPVRRLERRAPFGVAVGVALAALIVRFDVGVRWDSDFSLSRPHLVFWVFALGWAAARAGTTSRRLLVSALVLVAVPGFFETVSRDLIVAGGLLAITWIRTVPVPSAVSPAVGVLAASSLSIYLVHWQLYPPIQQSAGALVATVGSLAAGVGLWLVARRVRAVIPVLPAGRWRPGLAAAPA